MRQAVQQLQAAGVENPLLDARLLLQHAMGWDDAQYVAQSDAPLAANAQQNYQAMIARRAGREPLSHITGTRGFWRDAFIISADVLDPRPDSETLIEAMLDLRPERNAPYRIVDFGTGSGCLLLSLLREYPQATGLGVDCSEAALAVARANAKALNLQQRAEFICANWGETLTECYDMVISNPPYIGEQEIAQLAPEVKEHEPFLALCGGMDGLAAYHTLMPYIARHLAPDGITVMELGAGQADAVSAIALQHGLAINQIRADLAGIERALCINHRA